MKVIVSHDIDHITAWEHWRDLVLPKSIARSTIELARRRIGLAEYLLRFGNIAINKIQNLDELMAFDRENEVKSTFFIGVNSGAGLCYSLKKIEYWAKKIIQNGFEIGVHGISFDSFVSIKEEYNFFRKISAKSDFGIRMHYLRTSDNTLSYLSRAGYSYDSTRYEFANPFKVGKLWEFPLHVMDTYLFNKGTRWQSQNLEQVKADTLHILEEANNRGIEYFTLLLHDCYFSNGYRAWKDWYIWLIKYLNKKDIMFISYHEAVCELEKSLD